VALPKLGLMILPVVPTRLAEAAVLAEQVGYESIWLGEHVVAPRVFGTGNYPGDRVPFDPDSVFLEPFVALSHLAGITSRVRLGTSVAIFPVRNPFLTARAIATVDLLSGGRLDVGAGIGWMREEFEILGADFRTRGRRMDEFIEVLDRLFADEAPELDGEHYPFPPVGFMPKPVQRPRPKLHIAGLSDAALRRAARFGDGWLSGSGLRLEDAPARLSALREERERAGRGDAPFEVTLLALWPLAREQLEQAAAAGVDRFIVAPWGSRESPALPGAHDDVGAIERYAQGLGLSA
jgi:probable F420-dependent oxidoreductase